MMGFEIFDQRKISEKDGEGSRGKGKIHSRPGLTPTADPEKDRQSGGEVIFTVKGLKKSIGP